MSNMARESIVAAMCMTWRHDYGVTRAPDSPEWMSGMTDDERAGLRSQMAQIFDHHIAPIIAERRDAPPDAICLPGTEGRVWVRVSAAQAVQESESGDRCAVQVGDRAYECKRPLDEVLKALGWA